MNAIDPSVFGGAHPGFETRLVQHLQPIRGFALATSLFHLFSLGVADKLILDGPIAVSDLAEARDLDADRLHGFLLFLHAEGFLRLEEEIVTPLDPLREIAEAWPWYEMLIGGYAQTYLDMGKGLAKDASPLGRNGALVGSGSCKISHYDAIPLTRVLLDKIGQAPSKIVDLGCGNALYLKEFCAMYPGLTAVGVEPNVLGHARSAEEIATGPQAGRIRLCNATAQDFIAGQDDRDADALIIAFVLQEILGQEGREGTVAFLKDVVRGFPGAHVVVIEVDECAADPARMAHPLAQAYYNPYYLVHYFTGQTLEGPTFWRDLFAEAGLTVVTEATTNPNVDSSGLTMGFLLKC